MQVAALDPGFAYVREYPRPGTVAGDGPVPPVDPVDRVRPRVDGPLDPFGAEDSGLETYDRRGEIAGGRDRPAAGRADDEVAATDALPAGAVEDPAGQDEDPAAIQAEDDTPTDGRDLSEDEQRQVRELQSRDREVRAHEQAHVAAGGQYVTSGPNYTFQKGPDGRSYAIGGSVGIDTSAESTPEATIQKMAVVQRAALAPANPSGADRAIAAQAASTAAQARSELTTQRSDEAASALEDTDESAAIDGVDAANVADGISGADIASANEIASGSPAGAVPAPAGPDPGRDHRADDTGRDRDERAPRAGDPLRALAGQRYEEASAFAVETSEPGAVLALSA